MESYDTYLKETNLNAGTFDWWVNRHYPDSLHSVRYALSSSDEIFQRGQSMVPPDRNQAYIQRYGYGDLIVNSDHATGPKFHFLYNDGRFVYVLSPDTSQYEQFSITKAMYPADPSVDQINVANE